VHREKQTQYVCLAGIDPNYKQKFLAIKSILEQGSSNNPSFGCKLEVIDSTPYSQDQDPAILCTEILPTFQVHPTEHGKCPHT
jgi:hypothetical protein